MEAGKIAVENTDFNFTDFLTDLDAVMSLKAAIKFTDSGVGIGKESVGNLFKPFSQADPSLTRKFGGTGLGLILSKRLGTHFGGDLVLEKTEK